MDPPGIRVICSRLVIARNGPGLQWLIGSRFFPDLLAIASTFRCIHAFSPDDVFSVDYAKESDDLRVLIIKGALQKDGRTDQVARKAANAAQEMKKFLVTDDTGADNVEKDRVIGASEDPGTGDIQFFATADGSGSNLQSVTSVVYNSDPDKYVWEKGCLLHCQLPIKLPFYYPINNVADASEMYSSSIGAAAAMFKQSDVSFIVEASNKKHTDALGPAFLCGSDLSRSDPTVVRQRDEASKEPDKSLALCSQFCSESTLAAGNYFPENADIIDVNVLLNRSIMPTEPAAPGAVFFPAVEETKLLVLEFKLDIFAILPKTFC